MAKSITPKTKKCVMDTTATEVKPAVWEWTTGMLVWQYAAGGRFGINTSVARMDDPERAWTDLLYCKSLDFAVMFSWGVHTGINIEQSKEKK